MLEPMLVEPSPTPISCIVLSVWMKCIYAWKNKREEKMLPQSGGCGDGLIDASVAI